MEYIEIKEQIKQKLPVARDLGDSENLLELGLSSLTIMRLVNQWRKQGVKVSFGSLMENPTLEGWWALIQRSMKKKAGKKRAQESKITPEKDMKQPFPLTDVQYAYWVGRDEEQALGGIDCHAYLEFDGGNIDPERLEKEARDLEQEITHLIDSADNGRIMKEGIQTVILGRPNAGKSSLLNAMLGEERAIVTEVAGTTRDVLEESISLNGLTLNMIDTAGIRETEDVVERIGVERAKEKAQQADLILYVADSSQELDENDREILHSLGGKKAVLILNKSDLPPIVTAENLKKITGEQYPVLSVSARKGNGIELLEQTIRELFYRGELSFNDEVYITNARQKADLVNARESVLKVLESISLGLPEDFYSIDLMSAYEALGAILGESVGEDLVNEIFSRFCMGK